MEDATLIITSVIVIFIYVLFDIWSIHKDKE